MNCQELTSAITNIKAQLTEFDTAVSARKPEEAILIKNQIEKEIDKYELRIGYRFEKAKEILGQDFLGLEAIKAVFGFETIEIPPIPFSREELERAKELGQMLILRLPITMAEINKRLKGKVKDEKKLLYAFNELTGKLKDDCWYKNKPFYTTQTARPGWALVTKHVLGHKDGKPEEDKTEDSSNKNYLQQTEILIAYLRDKVFRGKTIPPKYQEAITEFEKGKGIKTPEEFKINQLIRRLPVETLYDITAYFQTTGERLLTGIYDWSAISGSAIYLVNNILVSIGYFDSDGVDVNGYEPSDLRPDLGVSFSRSL